MGDCRENVNFMKWSIGGKKYWREDKAMTGDHTTSFTATCLVGGRLGRGSVRVVDPTTVTQSRPTSEITASQCRPLTAVNASMCRPILGVAASQHRPTANIAASRYVPTSGVDAYLNKPGSGLPQCRPTSEIIAMSSRKVSSSVKGTSQRPMKLQAAKTTSAQPVISRPTRHNQQATTANPNDNIYPDDRYQPDDNLVVSAQASTRDIGLQPAVPSVTLLQRFPFAVKAPLAVQNISKDIRTHGQHFMTIILQLYLSICDRYNLESDWAKMGVRFRFKVIDAVVNLAILSPLTVLFYFSTWTLLDQVLLDKFPTIGSCFLLCLGVALETAGGFFQRAIHRRIHCPPPEPDTPLGYNFPAILFRYVIAFGNVCHMRSVDVLVRVYVGEDSYNGFKTLLTTLVLLISLKASNSIIQAPLGLVLDTDAGGLDHVTTLNNVEVRIRHVVLSVGLMGTEMQPECKPFT